MPDDDWALAQGTVDFRNEERRAFNAGPERIEMSQFARENPDGWEERIDAQFDPLYEDVERHLDAVDAEQDEADRMNERL